MLSVTRRDGVYFESAPRPSSKIWEFFGISPGGSISPERDNNTNKEAGNPNRRRQPSRRNCLADERFDNDDDDDRRSSQATRSEAVDADEEEDTPESSVGSTTKLHVDDHGARQQQRPYRIDLEREFLGYYRPEHWHEHRHQSRDIRQVYPSYGRQYRHEHQRLVGEGKNPLRAMVEGFGPIWFTWPTTTGLLALLLRLISVPHTFAALRTISSVFYLIDLILFVVFSTLITIRLLWFRGKAWRELVNGPELPFLALWPISWLTLVSALIFLAFDEPDADRQRWIALVAYGTWWVGAVWVLVAFVSILGKLLFFSASKSRQYREQPEGQFGTFLGQQQHHHQRRPGGAAQDQDHHRRTRIPSTALLPLVAVAILPIIGGILVSRLSPFQASRILSPGQAAPVLIFSFCTLGIVLLSAVPLYSILIHQLLLLHHSTPRNKQHQEPAHALLFNFLTPLAASSAALLLLGNAAVVCFGPVRQNITDTLHASSTPNPPGGTLLSSTAARPLNVACILIALLLIGAAILLFVAALFALADHAIVSVKKRRRSVGARGIRWRPTWTTFILPMAALALAAVQLGESLDSGFFGVLAVVFVVGIAVVFVFDLVVTLGLVFRGRLSGLGVRGGEICEKGVGY